MQDGARDEPFRVLGSQPLEMAGIASLRCSRGFDFDSEQLVARQFDDDVDFFAPAFGAGVVDVDPLSEGDLG